jgi:hypothetical protein
MKFLAPRISTETIDPTQDWPGNLKKGFERIAGKIKHPTFGKQWYALIN